MNPLDLLLQGTTTHLESELKNAGFFFKKLNLLRLVNSTSYY